jgi:iron complex outermembrane receptor protein
MKTHSRFRLAGRRLLAAAFAPCLAALLGAQTVPVTPLEDYVVTARRVAEDAVNVPAYTQVITGGQIRAGDATNLIDLLADEANLQFVSLSGSPSNTKVSMRGTGTGGNGRTLVLIDGIRANRPDMGDFNWLQFGLQDIASVEIFQGPQGAFYGDNAVGGVIKINTNGAPPASGGQAQILGGSDGTRQLAGGYTELIGPAWVTVTGGCATSDGWREHSGHDSRSAAIGAGYDNHRNSVTRLKVSFLENHYEQPGYLTEAQLRQGPAQEGAAASDGWSDYRRVTLSNVFGAGDRAKLLTDAGASFVKEHYNGGFGTQFDRTMDSVFFSPKLRLVRDALTLTAGVDANADELRVVTNTPVDSTLTRRTLSPYVTASWQATDTLAWSAAWRHEWNRINAREDSTSRESNRTDAGDAGQLALNWRPTAELRLYAKCDRAYRFPATDEISYYQGYGGGPAYNVFFNPALRPELSDNVELGGDWRKGAWRAGAAVYRLKTKDEIFYNGATNLNENLAGTRRTGAQFHASYEQRGWALRTRVDGVDAQLAGTAAGAGLVGTGELRMTPKWRTTTTAVWRPREGWELGLTHIFIAHSLVDDSYAGATPGEVAAVNLFEAKVNCRLNARWRLFAGARNLFDRPHVSYATIGYPPPSYAPTTIVYPGQGRSWYLGTSVVF